MSTNNLWTALLSDDPEEFDEALEAIAADSPEAVGATWDDADTWYGAAPERRAGARAGTMCKLLAVTAAVMLAAAGCGEDEPAPELVDPAGGFFTTPEDSDNPADAATADDLDGLSDTSQADRLALLEADMAASIPQRLPGDSAEEYIAALQDWNSELYAAIVSGGDATPLDLEIDRCVIEALVAAVPPYRVDQIADGLVGGVYDGIPLDAVTSDELAAFDEAARLVGCAEPLTAHHALRHVGGLPTASQEMVARCESALAASPDFVAAAARSAMFDDFEQRVLTVELVVSACDLQRLRVAGRDTARPVYGPGDDAAAYIDALLAWTTDSVTAALGVEVTEQTRALDSCLAGSLADVMDQTRLEALAAAFNAAGTLTASAVTSQEMAAFEQAAVAACGELLIAESDEMINELIAPPAGSSVAAAAEAEAIAKQRDDCVAALAADPHYMRVAAQTAMFYDAPAQDDMAQRWAELCAPYLTSAIVEQLIASGVPRDAAQCVAPALLEDIAAVEPSAAALEAMTECGLL